MFKNPLSQEAIAQIFTQARTYHYWTDRMVSDDTLHEIYEIMKWGPTALNSNPARILFLKNEQHKEKLASAMWGSNPAQVKRAPVTAILAYDETWTEYLPRLFQTYDPRPLLDGNEKLVQETVFRNSTLQGAYMIFAIRALGLDACGMSGFDNQQVDELFFKGTTWKTNFVCTLGYGDEEKLYPREPRLEFDEVCKIL
ncbi:MAG: malonic semialdehyde reductase [Ewingella americana]|jgi:3-hydroxypropanoate dehydrogenase|uniref:Nitroreductase n=2 Tax=Ewingella americana TaxID=41202 RepID=A0A085G0I9_EWIA3|nr:malonic semialdehyde reductase [Ewingella americana]KAA8726641.1 malonic semialdehyde reductase [Ewingella americana]KFC77234.1 nitroreductase [Ewingella americana ATCC 33852]MCI1678129.1 malonic semialdehyde reductase [Ewingella americana]MCI1856234.1 malonic semialdehyde reductase [Ewingella americana]MCI1862459.1 malonic semialdehyde reductase [Ewingella americana]